MIDARLVGAKYPARERVFEWPVYQARGISKSIDVQDGNWLNLISGCVQSLISLGACGSSLSFLLCPSRLELFLL